MSIENCGIISTDIGPSPERIAPRGFSIEDIEALHLTLITKGITCLQPPKKEEFGTLAEYADPDGLPFSVMEQPKKS